MWVPVGTHWPEGADWIQIGDDIPNKVSQGTSYKTEYVTYFPSWSENMSLVKFLDYLLIVKCNPQTKGNCDESMDPNDK